MPLRPWLTILLATAVAGCCFYRPHRSERPRGSPNVVQLSRTRVGALPNTQAEPRTGAEVDELRRISGCEEVRGLRIHKGDVVDMQECLRGGRVLSTLWTFAGDATNPATLPLLVDVIEPPDEEYQTWRKDPGVIGRLRARPGEQGLREISFRLDGILYRAIVHAVTEKETGALDIPRRSRTYGDWRIVSLEVGPKVANADAAKPLPLEIPPLVRTSAGMAASTCASERAVRLTTVCRTTEVEAGFVQRAEWTFHARDSLQTLGSLTSIKPLPADVAIVAETEPWERNGVRGFASRTVRWQDAGIDWTVELHTPPVYAYLPPSGSWTWRPSRRAEWRVRRVTQIPVDRAPPLDPSAPRLSLARDIQFVDGDAEVHPRTVEQPRPRYPPDLRALDITGQVILGMEVAVTGEVVEIVVLRSAPGFDEVALRAVERWRYEPFVVDGTPIAWRSNANLFFKLR